MMGFGCVAAYELARAVVGRARRRDVLRDAHSHQAQERDRRRAHAGARESADAKGSVPQLPQDGAPASGRQCPECQGAFRIVRIDDTPVDVCGACGGIWFDRGELAEVCGASWDIPARGYRSSPSQYRCPTCTETMTEDTWLAPHELRVDACPSQHGVYLNRGELERILELAS